MKSNRNESSDKKFTSGSFLKVLMPKISRVKSSRRDQLANDTQIRKAPRPNRPTGAVYSR